jgi:hypothetical protein
MRGFLLLSFLFLASPSWADSAPLSLRYALAREVELGKGSIDEAVNLYREILPVALAADPALAAKVLFRIGSCERERGRTPEASQAWRQLIETYPAVDPLVVKAREEIKELDREVGRVSMRGRAVDALGQPLAGVFVMVGDWGNAPPLITGVDGTFQANRQMAGRLANGERYGLVFAEHPVQPLTLAAVWRESVSSAPVFCLRPAISLAGYVVDPRGRPVVGAILRVTGFANGLGEVPIPVGRFFPTVRTDTNGQFRMNGLVEGLRYRVAAEKEGYRMEGNPVEGLAVIKPNVRPGAGAPPVAGALPDVRVVFIPEITMHPVGQIAVDESGVLRAEVNLNDPAERARLEEALAVFDPEKKSDRERGRGGASGGLSNRFPYADFPFSLRWLRGDPVTGSPLGANDLNARVVVYHFSSAYLDASLKRQFPDEPGLISQMARLFSRQGVLCIWIIPAADNVEDATRLALETGVDVPIAVDRDGAMEKALGVMGYGGNVVVDRDGMMRAVCPDHQLFKVLKGVLVP